MPALGSLRKKISVFKASLGYRVSLSQKQKQKANSISTLKRGIMIKLFKNPYI